MDAAGDGEERAEVAAEEEEEEGEEMAAEEEEEGGEEMAAEEHDAAEEMAVEGCEGEDGAGDWHDTYPRLYHRVPPSAARLD